MVRKRVLTVLLLLCLIFALVVGFHNRFQKTKGVSLLDNSDVFEKMDEVKAVSDNMSVYDSKITYFINNINWDNEGEKGIAEVSFQAPDLEKMIKECIEIGGAEGVTDLINKKLESGTFEIKEYIITMDAVKENGDVKIVPNDEMIEIMNGSCDSILADLYEEVVREG